MNKIRLIKTKRTHPQLLNLMSKHYSQPKGFVGRVLCYAIYYENIYYGHIIAGSTPKWLKGRDEFLGIGKKQLNNVISNIFYHVEKVNGRYPIRNFTAKILKKFMEVSKEDWERKYGDEVIGYDALIEKPRTGSLYKKAKWVCVGETIGYQCKRPGGVGTDSWTGKRIWITDKLRPKWIFCYKIKEKGELTIDLSQR